MKLDDMKNSFIYILCIILLISCSSKSVVLDTKKLITQNQAIHQINVTNKKALVFDKDETAIQSKIVAGKKICENNYANCHKLFSPKDFNKNDWLPILKDMQKKADLNNN